MPAVSPLTAPAELTLATAGLLLLQVPPLTVDDSVVVALSHTVVAPLMVPAVAPVVTAKVVVTLVMPQLLLTE